MQFWAAAQDVWAKIKQRELFFCSLLRTTINSERTQRYKLQVWVWPKIYHQYGWLERNTTGWLLMGNAVSSREASPIKISSSHPIQKQGMVSWGPSRLAPLMRKLRNMQHPEWTSVNGNDETNFVKWWRYYKEREAFTAFCCGFLIAKWLISSQRSVPGSILFVCVRIPFRFRITPAIVCGVYVKYT